MVARIRQDHLEAIAHVAVEVEKYLCILWSWTDSFKELSASEKWNSAKWNREIMKMENSKKREDLYATTPNVSCCIGKCYRNHSRFGMVLSRSVLLFNAVLDFGEEKFRQIQWDLYKFLKNLDFADHVMSFQQVLKDTQIKLS